MKNISASVSGTAYAVSLRHNPNLSEIINAGNLILLMLSFLIGRVSIGGVLILFGVPAFFVLFYSVGGVIPLICAGLTIIGMITAGISAGNITETLAGMMISIFLLAIMKIPNERVSKTMRKHYLKTGILCFASTTFPSIISDCIGGFLLFDLLSSLLNGLMAFCAFFIFRNAIEIFNKITFKKITSNKITASENKKTGNAGILNLCTTEEAISAAIVILLALTGFNGITIFGLSLMRMAFFVLLLLYANERGSGAGAATGVFAGIIGGIAGTGSFILPGVYGFCGLLSGMLRKIGRLGTCLGLILGNTVLTLYATGSVAELIKLSEIILASAVFFLIPKKTADLLTFVTPQSDEAVSGFPEMSRNKKYIRKTSPSSAFDEKLRKGAIGKLEIYSRSLRELAKVFNEPCTEGKKLTDYNEQTLLYDAVAQKVCKDCSLSLHCWDANFCNTNQVFEGIIIKLEKRGRIEKSDLPPFFTERCERLTSFTEALNSNYEVLLLERSRMGCLDEGRNIIKSQFMGISKLIEKITLEMKTDIKYRADLTNAVIVGLGSAGIRYHEVEVRENADGKLETTVIHHNCDGRKKCMGLITKSISVALGRRMVVECGSCRKNINEGICNLKFIEKETFGIVSGIARETMTGSAMSGDSYVFINAEHGKYMIVLSDGMGSGRKAATQSRITVEFFERFIESGFDREVALSLLNSFLLARSGEEVFASIDLAVFDLYEGEAEFIKAGAAPTFIKRAGASILSSGMAEVIRTCSLPAGILPGIETEVEYKNFSDGDVVVMVSDGITGAFKNSEKPPDISPTSSTSKDGDFLLARFLAKLDAKNPQEIADRIIDEAKRLSEGEPADDMLVIVAKVKEC